MVAGSRSAERKLVLARVPFGAEERSDSPVGATKENTPHSRWGIFFVIQVFYSPTLLVLNSTNGT